MKTRDAVDGFHQLENSQTLPRFSSAYEGTENCFISFMKLVFFFLTKRKTIYEARTYTLISSHKTVNSHNLEIANHIAHIIFLLHLRNKTCFPPLHVLVKIAANVWENSRADQWKPETQSRVFTCSRILKNFAEVFNRLWRHGQHVFISFIELLFSVLTKRKTIYDARTVNSHNSEPQSITLLTSFSCFITLRKHTCRPIRTQTLSKLNYNLL